MSLKYETVKVVVEDDNNFGKVGKVVYEKQSSYLVNVEFDDGSVRTYHYDEVEVQDEH